MHAGHLVGHLLLSAEYVAEQVGGHGWLRRWSPFNEVAVVHVRFLHEDRTEVFW